MLKVKIACASIAVAMALTGCSGEIIKDTAVPITGTFVNGGTFDTTVSVSITAKGVDNAHALQHANDLVATLKDYLTPQVQHVSPVATATDLRQYLAAGIMEFNLAAPKAVANIEEISSLNNHYDRCVENMIEFLSLQPEDVYGLPQCSGIDADNDGFVQASVLDKVASNQQQKAVQQVFFVSVKSQGGVFNNVP